MAGKHIDALDGVRGLAVLMVVFFHAGGGAKSSNHIVRFVGTVNKYGWTGVTLFFVLSGFLITGILWDTRHDPRHLKNFYARRSLRIFPLYYLALVFVVLGSISLGAVRECLSHIWIYALYLQNVIPVGNNPLILPSHMETIHFWSLAVEEQFYLLWPALMLRTKNFAQAAKLCVVVFFLSTIGKIAYAIYATAPVPHNYSLWANAGSLVVGGFIAITVRQGIDLRSKAPLVMAVSFVVFILASFYAPQRVLISVDILSASLFWGGVIVMTLQPGIIQRVFTVRWLRWFGGISYGLYVYHWLFRAYFDRIATRIDPHASVQTHEIIRLVVLFGLSTLIAWLSFGIFERPMSNLKRYFRSPAAKVATVSTT